MEDEQEYYKEYPLSQKGHTYGDSYINRMSMLKTCAQYMIYLSAGINLVALRGINTLLSNVSTMMMKP